MFTSPGSRTSRYRHIVFAEAARPSGPAVNLAPAGSGAIGFPADAGWDDEGTGGGGLRGEDAFLRWVFRRASLDAGRYRPETLRRRVPACLRAVRAASPAHARVLITRNPALLEPAINALLIGVTSLWRDPAVVSALASLLPRLAAGRSELRAWSAGCSHGAELYTLATVLADLGLLGRSYLLGTDCRAEATRRAADGFFDLAEARNVPGPLLQRYFTPAPGGVRAGAEIRAAVNWRTADLLCVHEPGAWDLILCRNVAMYMNADAAASLWARFETSLRPGGLLVLGRAERPAGAGRMSPAGPCIYKRSLG